MKYIFIHIPKTGGRSIEKDTYLSKIAIQPKKQHLNLNYANKLIKAMMVNKSSCQFQHSRWKDLDEKYTNQYPSVSIVRNPWSKLVSQYLFGQKVFNEGNAARNASVTNKTTFEEFLNLRDSKILIPYNWHRTIAAFHLQKNHVTDNYGNLKCSILRFEHYDKDTTEFFNLKYPIKKYNISNIKKLDYRHFYTEGTKKMVYKWYEEDIDFFGFTFDGGATKNIWNSK